MTPMENSSSERLLAVGRGKSNNLGLVSLEYLDWASLVSMSSIPLEAPIDHADFMALPKVERNRLKKAPFVSFGVFQDGVRNKTSVSSRSAAQLDYDHETLELFRRLEETEFTGGVMPFSYVGHTTRSHTDEAPRLRLMVPFSRDVTPEEYPHCVHAIHDLLGATEMDRASLEPSRLMYLPVVNRNAPFWCWQSKGTGYVDPDYLLSLTHVEPEEELSDLDIALAEKPLTFYQKVNSLAMKSFAAWVPALFPEAQPYKEGGYRITSASLGRALEEDISIVSEGIKDFGVADQGDPQDGKRTPIDLVLEWRELENAADAANWICGQLELDPAALGGKSNAPTAADLAFRFYSGDAYAEDFTSAEEIVEDLLPAQGLAMLYGQSGCGKTFWMLDMAFHIHNGIKWRDKDVKQGDVMYVAAEAGRGIKKRIQAVKAQHPDWHAPFIADTAPNLGSMTSVEAVRDAAKAAGNPAVIIVDTMSASFEGDDSSQQDVAKMLRNLKVLADDLQCLVIFVHHATKEGGSHRGSGVFYNDVDAVLEGISEGEGAGRKLWIKQLKHREGEAGKTYPFSLAVSAPLAFKPNGKPVTSCTITQEDYETPARKGKERKSTGGDFETSDKYAKARKYLQIIEEAAGLGDANIDETDVISAIQADETVNPLKEPDHPRPDNVKRTLLTLAERGKIKREGRWIRVCQ